MFIVIENKEFSNQIKFNRETKSIFEVIQLHCHKILTEYLGSEYLCLLIVMCMVALSSFYVVGKIRFICRNICPEH